MFSGFRGASLPVSLLGLLSAASPQRVPVLLASVCRSPPPTDSREVLTAPAWHVYTGSVS